MHDGVFMLGEVLERITFEHKLLRPPLPVLGPDQVTERFRRVYFALDAEVGDQRRLVSRHYDQGKRQPHTQQRLEARTSLLCLPHSQRKHVRFSIENGTLGKENIRLGEEYVRRHRKRQTQHRKH